MSTDGNTAVAPSPALSTAKQALLAKWLRGRPNGNGSATDTIPKRTDSGPAPLSFEQQRLWFFHQLEPESPLYTMPIASRLSGELRPEILQRAMDFVVARHESLRTHFISEGPSQMVNAPSSVPMRLIDLTERGAMSRSATPEAEARRLLEAEIERPFDLSRDLMVRSTLIRLDEREWVFFVLMHHIASDDWSWRVFCNELTLAYEALIHDQQPELPVPPIQYTDFSAWQKEWWRGDVLEEHLGYWRKQLSDAPAVLELPTDHPRPASQTFRGASEWLKLPPALTEKINSFSQRAGVTPFMILLAAFQTLLHRYTGQEDIVVGSPVAGRTRASLEKVIGLFVNMLVLRTQLEGNPTFIEFLRRTQTTVLEALAQQDLPFEKLVEELQPQRSASYSPLIQVMFALQDELSESVRLPGVSVAPFSLETGTAKFDLTLTIVKGRDGWNCCAEYNSDLFEPATARRLLAHYARLLEGIAAKPEQRVSDLPLLTNGEREQLLVEWNSTEADFPSDKCVHELFSAQANETPNSVAAVFGKHSLTYRELNCRANQFANHLRRLGVGPESLVAISMERSLEMIIAIIGTLKAGGAYVPLDPSYPAERLRFMLEDSKASLLLTISKEKEHADKLKPNGVRTICLDTDWPLIAAELEDEPRFEMSPENLAYVIYTSGSTGQPKGVQIPHRAVVNFLHSMRREPGLTSADTLLSVTSISFDIAALEIFLPLIVGARVVLASMDEVFDAEKMKASIRESHATVMQATPSFWRFLVDSEWSGNKRIKILCGGESLSRELADALLKRGAEVWNLYGPTETTIWSTLDKVAPRETISIGRPIANTQVYLLDSHLQPVPVGVPGEMHIGGEGLARGYLNRPELTAGKFLAVSLSPRGTSGERAGVRGGLKDQTSSPRPSPPSGEEREKAALRLYKTGDVARYRADGKIEWLGRTDFQVKLRGHRIDLGEIESTLRQQPNVREAIVLLRENEVGEKNLAAYLVCANESALDTGEAQRFLKTKLPDYMIPGVFVTLEKFPLTPNGKINRKALPALESNAAMAHREFTPPRTQTEEWLVKIWQELLRIEQIGIHDDFFETGGHSLLAMQLMARVRAAFQADLSLRNVFEAPTIAEMAAILETNSNRRAMNSIAPVPRARRISPAQAQELLGKLDDLSETEVESLLQQVSDESL
jgi:amino acid adenylation domain-containing protein